MSRSQIYGSSHSEVDVLKPSPIENFDIETEKAYAERIYNEVREANKKDAEQKKEQMEQFNAAIDLACLINDVCLFIHYCNLVATFIEASKLEDKKMAEAREHIAELVEASQYPKPVLPTEQQNFDAYKNSLSIESQQTLQELNTKITEIEGRILDKANWGAETWEEGVKIQTQELHDKFEKDINEGKFLNVIKVPEGESLQIPPEALERAKAEHHKVNNAMQEFLLQMKPPEPNIKSTDEKIVLGTDIPAAPSLPPTFVAPTKTAASKSQMEKDLEVFFVNLSRGAWKNIGDPIVKPFQQAGTDLNSFVRLAVNSFKDQAHDFKMFLDKCGNFVNDKMHLDVLKDAVEKIKATPEPVQEEKSSYRFGK